jgi:polyisoprenoid-binding protein YceI
MTARLVPLFALATLATSAVALADTPQQFSARVGDAVFVSDDDGITLIPIGSSFTLTASTAGASAYPPPKTRIDRLSIICDGYTQGASFDLDAEDFRRSTCDVRFVYGTRPFGEAPDAEYQLDKSSTDNRFEVTSARGKVIEGRFRFRLRDDAGKHLPVVDGRFVAEDRQY